MNVPSKNLTVCLVSDQLAGGGAERFSAQLSLFLNDHAIDIQHVIVLDALEYPHAGTVFNLGKIKTAYPGIWGRWLRLQQLRLFFKTHSFDLIIDTRVKKKFWQEWFIHRWLYRAPYLLLVHSARTEWYIPSGQWGARWIYQKAAAVVAVSQGIAQKLADTYALHNVKVIPTAITHFPSGSPLELPPFILAVGRMNDTVKQYDRLITLYAQSTLPQKGIHLVILGEGDYLETYRALAQSLHVGSYVHFQGRVANPGTYYRQAMFTVLTSKNEGFPLVLLESLALGTPVVAYDCPTGPGEIIQHETNGLLVPDQNEGAFIAALERMISDKNLYLHCKDQASKTIQSYSWDVVGAQWLELIAQIR